MKTSGMELRQARMEFKTTTNMKELLSQAAALDGIDLTSFVLIPAIQKARQVLSEHANIALAKQGQAALIELLNHPAAPTSAMQDLMALPDFPARSPNRKTMRKTAKA